MLVKIVAQLFFLFSAVCAVSAAVTLLAIVYVGLSSVGLVPPPKIYVSESMFRSFIIVCNAAIIFSVALYQVACYLKAEKHLFDD